MMRQNTLRQYTDAELQAELARRTTRPCYVTHDDDVDGIHNVPGAWAVGDGHDTLFYACDVHLAYIVRVALSTYFEEATVRPIKIQ
jgi:hypothetical protein